MVAFFCWRLDGISTRVRDSACRTTAHFELMMDAILRDLQQPEYLHVLLNPIPVYGLAIAFFGLVAATYLRSRGGQLTALVLIFASALSVWPVVYHGDRAYDRVLSMADDDGQAWLKAHEHRADELVFVYYVLALAT